MRLARLEQRHEDIYLQTHKLSHISVLPRTSPRTSHVTSAADTGLTIARRPMMDAPYFATPDQALNASPPPPPPPYSSAESLPIPSPPTSKNNVDTVPSMADQYEGSNRDAVNGASANPANGVDANPAERHIIDFYVAGIHFGFSNPHGITNPIFLLAYLFGLVVVVTVFGIIVSGGLMSLYQRFSPR